jgi:ParB-like chromosome segregation protein Spo0J
MTDRRVSKLNDSRSAEPSWRSVAIHRIEVPEDWRPVSTKKIQGLADSISVLGLQNPISLLRPNGMGKKYKLVAGRYRLEAAKLLGLTEIKAEIVERQCAKAWHHSENLHRAELSCLEELEAIRGYMATRKALPVQSGQPRGGRQPNDAGISATARELGLHRRTIRLAKSVSQLSENVKTEIRRARLDDNATEIARIAKCKTEAEQLSAVVGKGRRPAATEGKTNKKASKEAETAESTQDGDVATQKLLRSLWKASELKRAFDASDASEQTKFVRAVFLPILSELDGDG